MGQYLAVGLRLKASVRKEKQLDGKSVGEILGKVEDKYNLSEIYERREEETYYEYSIKKEVLDKERHEGKGCDTGKTKDYLLVLLEDGRPSVIIRVNALNRDTVSVFVHPYIQTADVPVVSASAVTIGCCPVSNRRSFKRTHGTPGKHHRQECKKCKHQHHHF